MLLRERFLRFDYPVNELAELTHSRRDPIGQYRLRERQSLNAPGHRAPHVRT
jgi:hypothetical protein